jgi:hypothetical protein
MSQVAVIGTGLAYCVYAISSMNFPFSVYYVLLNEGKWNVWMSLLVLIVMKPLLVIVCFEEILILLIGFSSIFSTIFWAQKAW